MMSDLQVEVVGIWVGGACTIFTWKKMTDKPWLFRLGELADIFSNNEPSKPDMTMKTINSIRCQ